MKERSNYLREALAFLRLHQRPDGAFGFFGPEEQQLSRRLGASLSSTVEISPLSNG